MLRNEKQLSYKWKICILTVSQLIIKLQDGVTTVFIHFTDAKKSFIASGNISLLNYACFFQFLSLDHRFLISCSVCYLHIFSHAVFSSPVFPFSNRLPSLSTTASWTWCSSSSPSSGEFFLAVLFTVRAVFPAVCPAAPHRAFSSQRLFAQVGHNLSSMSCSGWQQPQARHLTPNSSGDLVHVFSSNRQKCGVTPV